MGASLRQYASLTVSLRFSALSIGKIMPTEICLRECTVQVDHLKSNTTFLNLLLFLDIGH